MAVVVFWFCVSSIAYVYVGYPFALRILARLKPKSPAADQAAAGPSVTVIIAAYNEEAVLGDKLANTFSLDYPKDKLEVIVASDGSTDRTDDIAAGFQPQGVRLVRVEGRRGKTAAQNAAAAVATGEILVFSDANALYESDAILRLVAGFADPGVGCVEGRRVDFIPHVSATARHELTYRDWESRIKTWESLTLSCTGATGPIYAVRRHLYIPLDPGMISDLMEPIMIMTRHGKRHIFQPDAISREAVNSKLRDEFHRKVRIMTRCLNSLRNAPEVMNPFRNGWFAIQVISHRLLRWLAPSFALVGIGANLFLLNRPFYRATLLAQGAFAAVAGLGYVLDRLRIVPTFLRLPYYFCAANLAALAALGNCIMGRNIVAWRTYRT